MSTSQLLTLTQWLSPAFPVSAYAYSHGLEQVIDSAALGDAQTLQLWLEDVLHHGSGQSDAILLACAYRADLAQLSEVDGVARAYAASAGRLTETVDQGAAFTRTVNDIWGGKMPSLCYPVAVGHAAAQQDLPLQETVELYLQAFLATLVSAAVRLVPLGQTEGQAVLAAVSLDIHDVARRAIGAGLEDLSGCCFALDIAAMRHETQYSKVFRT